MHESAAHTIPTINKLVQHGVGQATSKKQQEGEDEARIIATYNTQSVNTRSLQIS
jgi:hypothetical protein